MSCYFAGGAAQKGNLDLKKGRESTTREQPEQKGSGVSPHQEGNIDMNEILVFLWFKARHNHDDDDDDGLLYF
ncbi:P2Y purinoceptor 2-like [Platysternon megacephalum]|uniref:P2Y purinoceptor 2-like n=1 Tax=Platysternon megacephalum TaxID=55544 RepID=A0A4D9EF91_9SAUR|nr:P2Y purinoceptor 2-like [Platysternon megacephalum]